MCVDMCFWYTRGCNRTEFVINAEYQVDDKRSYGDVINKRIYAFMSEII